jgi:hypothetical protein
MLLKGLPCESRKTTVSRFPTAPYKSLESRKHLSQCTP